MVVVDILRFSFLIACFTWSCFKFDLNPHNVFTPTTLLNCNEGGVQDSHNQNKRANKIVCRFSILMETNVGARGLIKGFLATFLFHHDVGGSKEESASSKVNYSLHMKGIWWKVCGRNGDARKHGSY
jgi:hypothetical protein